MEWKGHDRLGFVLAGFEEGSPVAFVTFREPGCYLARAYDEHGVFSDEDSAILWCEKIVGGGSRPIAPLERSRV